MAVIGAGITTLRLSKILAERGAATESELSKALGESITQTGRYLQTLQSEGFALKKEGRWVFGLEGYRLPQLFFSHLYNQAAEKMGEMEAFLRSFFAVTGENDGQARATDAGAEGSD
jgi:DNA-binding IclR family transcriptional regulator